MQGSKNEWHAGLLTSMIRQATKGPKLSYQVGKVESSISGPLPCATKHQCWLAVAMKPDDVCSRELRFREPLSTQARRVPELRRQGQSSGGILSHVPGRNCCSFCKRKTHKRAQCRHRGLLSEHCINNLPCNLEQHLQDHSCCAPDSELARKGSVNSLPARKGSRSLQAHILQAAFRTGCPVECNPRLNGAHTKQSMLWTLSAACCMVAEHYR